MFTIRRVNDETIEKIKAWEGEVLFAYDDASAVKRPVKDGERVRGTLTIGVGHTGPDVFPGQTITAQESSELLRKDLDHAERAVTSMVEVPLTDNQFGALVSFVFNVGVTAFEGSTLLKKLNDRQYDAVPLELMKWVRGKKDGKSVKLPGLIRRRSLEAGFWSKSLALAATSQALVEVRPVKPPIATKENVSWGVGVLSALTANFADNKEAQMILLGMVVVAFIVGLVFVIKGRTEG